MDSQTDDAAQDGQPAGPPLATVPSPPATHMTRQHPDLPPGVYLIDGNQRDAAAWVLRAYLERADTPTEESNRVLAPCMIVLAVCRGMPVALPCPYFAFQVRLLQGAEYYRRVLSACPHLRGPVPPTRREPCRWDQPRDVRRAGDPVELHHVEVHETPCGQCQSLPTGAGGKPQCTTATSLLRWAAARDKARIAQWAQEKKQREEAAAANPTAPKPKAAEKPPPSPSPTRYVGPCLLPVCGACFLCGPGCRGTGR